MFMRQFFTSIAAIALVLSAMTVTAQTDGFSYQAVVRNAAGELVDNSKVGLRLTLTVGQNGDAVYQETHTPTTNSYGQLSVTVGTGAHAEGQSLQNVNWASGDVWMRVEIDPDGGTQYTGMGSTKLQSVPYAFYAATGGGRDGVQVQGSKGQTLVHDGTTWVATDEISLKKLDVKGATTNDDALFEVKDKDGKVVFAVYPEGVHVYIDPDADGGKVRRSGFYITGREDSKDGENNDFFSVDGNGTQVFVDDNNNGDKVRRSGFYITGREDAKGGQPSNYLAVNDEGTKVFVDNQLDDNDSKVRRSGFYITGREDAKDGQPSNYLAVNDEGTKVFIDNQLDDNDSKVRRSGFLITGRDSQKDGETTNYMKVATDGTLVHFDNDASKVRRSGFLITGRDASKGTNEEYMAINTDSTRFYIDGAGSAKGFAVGELDGGDKEGTVAGGFAVTGRDGSKGTASNLFNIDLSTDAKIIKGENRIYWYPEKNAFMAGNLMVNSADSVGENSFSTGFQSKAVGNYSQAMGYKTMATGETSTAIGNETKATGKSSFAFGKMTEATDENAVAIGNTAKATSANAYALGLNSTASGSSSYAFGSSAQATKSNAYSFGASAQATGENAVAIGNTAKASEKNAYALGLNSAASGEGSYAIGEGAIASGKGSFALGRTGDINGTIVAAPKATGNYSYAIGPGAEANDNRAIAIGYNCKVKKWNSVALGWSNEVNKENSAAIGYSNTIDGVNSVAIGFNCSTGSSYSYSFGRLASANKTYSVAIGFNATANSASEVVVGTWNDNEGETIGSVDSNSPNSRAFVVGSGWESWSGGQTIHRRNALVVLRNGDMTVTGNLTYKSASQSSDMRLKKDVQQLDGALDKVLKLRGVSYYWKNAEELAAINGKELFGFDDKKHIGVIAQEVEEVLPELVVTDNEGFKSVKYENITPVLIEAIKEQQAEIEELRSVKAENEAIKKEIAEMKKMLEELMKK